MNDLIEFVENIYPIPLTDLQKNFLKTYERERKDGRRVFAIFPRMCGRRIFEDIIREREGNNQ